MSCKHCDPVAAAREKRKRAFISKLVALLRKHGVTPHMIYDNSWFDLDGDEIGMDDVIELYAAAKAERGDA